MKKITLILALLFTSLVTFSTISEAAASVSPSSQTLRGSTATANWTFKWNRSGGHTVRSQAGDGTPGVVWDSNNTVGTIEIWHTYYSPELTERYYPTFMAIRNTDGTTVGATATVVKKLP